MWKIINHIQEYINKGFSLIPLANNSKIPPKGFQWLPYQSQRASIKEKVEGNHKRAFFAPL